MVLIFDAASIKKMNVCHAAYVAEEARIAMSSQ